MLQKYLSPSNIKSHFLFLFVSKILPWLRLFSFFYCFVAPPKAFLLSCTCLQLDANWQFLQQPEILFTLVFITILFLLQLILHLQFLQVLVLCHCTCICTLILFGKCCNTLIVAVLFFSTLGDIHCADRVQLYAVSIREIHLCTRNIPLAMLGKIVSCNRNLG